MKRRFFLETLAAASAAPFLSAEPASGEGVSRYDVLWDSPSADSLGSMPLGNGETGLNVWVERGGDLMFYIGRSDAFSEDHSNIKLGRVRVQLSPNPFAAGLPFRQKLELDNACIRIDAGRDGEEVQLTIWVDANQPVARIEGRSAIPRTVSISYEMWRPLKVAGSPGESVSGGGDVLVDDHADRLLWYHRNESSVWSQRLSDEGLDRLVAGKVADPLLHNTFGGMIRGSGFQRTGPAGLSVAAPANRFDLAVHFHAGQYPDAQRWASALETRSSG